MKSRFLSRRISPIIVVMIFLSLSSCFGSNLIEKQTTLTAPPREIKITLFHFTATPIIQSPSQSPTGTPDVVLTAFASFPTHALFPTSTNVVISLPTRQDVDNFPRLPMNDLGNGEDYITVSKNSTYLWIVSCAGKDAQDLQKNANDMHVTFLINNQIVEKRKILEFDETFGPNNITRTWAILISGWQINTTTKVEMHYSLYQVSNINGLFTTKGDWYQIVYVSAQ